MPGRKSLPKSKKRQLVALRLPPQVINFLRKNKNLGSQSQIIIEALKLAHKELRN